MQGSPAVNVQVQKLVAERLRDEARDYLFHPQSHQEKMTGQLYHVFIMGYVTSFWVLCDTVTILH